MELTPAELRERIVAIIARVGGGVTDAELLYQLRRRGVDVGESDVVAACFELVEAGRLDATTYFRIPKEVPRAA